MKQDFSTFLRQLPTDLITALNPGFVYLIQKDHTQHFPARNWTLQAIQQELAERYHELADFHDNAQLQIAYLPKHELIVIVPQASSHSDSH